MSIMTDLRKKKFLLAGLSVMLGATMLATGCGKKSASGGGSAGGDKPFFIGYTNAPSGFNPIFNADTSASHINLNFSVVNSFYLVFLKVTFFCFRHKHLHWPFFYGF